MTRRIGIALGAGGAKGIAHIPMLEALDEFGNTPHRIAGSSIGAVILESGPLQPAVQASMAIPGVFTPVELERRRGISS